MNNFKIILSLYFHMPTVFIYWLQCRRLYVILHFRSHSEVQSQRTVKETRYFISCNYIYLIIIRVNHKLVSRCRRKQRFPGKGLSVFSLVFCLLAFSFLKSYDGMKNQKICQSRCCCMQSTLSRPVFFSLDLVFQLRKIHVLYSVKL